MIWSLTQPAIGSADRDPEIQSRHNTMTGKVVVTVDGDEVGEDRMVVRDKHMESEIDGHPARIDATVEHGGSGAGTVHRKATDI